MNTMNVIPPGVSEACLQLLAVDDEIVESNELFTAVVEAHDPNDMVDGATSFAILDNDGNNNYSGTPLQQFALRTMDIFECAVRISMDFNTFITSQQRTPIMDTITFLFHLRLCN